MLKTLFTHRSCKRLVLPRQVSNKEQRVNNSHNGARTTVYSRALMVDRVMNDGISVKEVAHQMGLSRRTVYKWLSRYRQGGPAALYNRSSRPCRSPRRMPVERVAVIAGMRRMRMSGPQIALFLCLPFSTVGLELRRLGLNKLSVLEPRPPVIRYEHKAPGDMIHLDIKKLGRIDGVGHRITGDRSKPRRKPGWEYLHVCVDDNSRSAYTEMLPDEKAISAACFLIRTVDWYRRQGITVKRVMTDNGGCYRSYLFKTAVRYLGLKHVRTRPYTPRTNGKAERFIQTSIREWAYSQTYESSAERQDNLGPWTDYYN
ncbi:MAG: IS481 family transposase, partial [Desulfarculaceae bacterium]